MVQSQILELKSQGLDQREMAHVLHVSPTTITFDLKYLRKEARETIREYTTVGVEYLYSIDCLSVVAIAAAVLIRIRC
jgi:orotate phosphoribosyltransferase-like protein